MLRQVTLALRTRKRTFLSETPWKTLPWSRHEKTPRDHLVDILFDIPALFEDLDTMMSDIDPIQKDRLHRRISKGYLKVDKALVDWHTNFAPSTDMSPWHLDGTKMPDTVTPSDLVAAHLMTIYWVTCIILYSLVRDVLLSNKTANQRPSFPGDAASAEKDPNTACRNLVRTLPLFFHRDAGTFRVHLATFPISVALIHLTHAVKPGDMLEERRIFDWCLQKPECSTIRRFMSSMRPEQHLGDHTATAISHNQAPRY